MNSENEKVVMYVEDEYYNYLVIEKMLKYKNIRLLHASNGEIALKMFNEHPELCMVLMDLKIGQGMNGLDVTREIKKIRPEIPVIAITAYAISGDREKIIAAGCNDYISKPVIWDVLLDTVQKYL